jgi:glycosyltransferase involved in cell wall biosynthesis
VLLYSSLDASPRKKREARRSTKGSGVLGLKNGVDWTEAVREQLTIVIPAFRCAAYLSAAVASAVHSSVRRILIAEDAGDDETLRLAEELSSAHPDRIRVLRSPTNRGTAGNLNDAAERVETPFFAKLDGDDVLIPGYLESVFPLIASRPRLAVLAGHELRIEADDALEFRPELLPAVSHRAAPRIMTGLEAYRFIINWNPNPTSSGVIYRTEAFREIGGFDRAIRWGEDWEIWLRFARQWEVAYVTAPSALYRIHTQSATAAAVRENRLCYGYDSVFRHAAALCPYPEMLPLIRRRMFGVARLYAAAAWRLFWRSRRESLECCRQAVRTLCLAVRSRNPGASSGVLARPSPTGPEIENVR